MTMLSWPAWGTTACLSVTDPTALHAAQRLAHGVLARSERSADRSNPRAELHRLTRSAGRPIRVSHRLAAMVGACLDAARASDGLVDPTIGNAVVLAARPDRPQLPTPRNTSWLPVCTGAVPPTTHPAIGWPSIDLDDRYVTVPPGVLLDLTAIAKAVTAQHGAELISRQLGIGVMLGLGEDIATAGPAPAGGWPLSGPLGPLPAGAGQAHVHRQVFDPRTGAPAGRVWASVTVRRCGLPGSVVEAKTLAVSAAVVAAAAPLWLDERGVEPSSYALVPASTVRPEADVVALRPRREAEPTLTPDDAGLNPATPQPA
jgi:thiamine biosynthesis lipoprotein